MCLAGWPCVLEREGYLGVGKCSSLRRSRQRAGMPDLFVNRRTEPLSRRECARGVPERTRVCLDSWRGARAPRQVDFAFPEALQAPEWVQHVRGRGSVRRGGDWPGRLEAPREPTNGARLTWGAGSAPAWPPWSPSWQSPPSQPEVAGGSHRTRELRRRSSPGVVVSLGRARRARSAGGRLGLRARQLSGMMRAEEHLRRRRRRRAEGGEAGAPGTAVLLGVLPRELWLLRRGAPRLKRARGGLQAAGSCRLITPEVGFQWPPATLAV